MLQEKKLNKFNSLYNKFIFQWSEGKALGDIVTILKAQKDKFQDCSSDNICNTELNKEENIQCCNTQCEDQCNNQEYCSQDDIKNCFYEKFPKFLIIKCQNKFPIDDNIKVPDDIICKYWNENKEVISKALVKCIKDALIDEMQKVFIQIFGKQNEYNQNLFNESALQLVSSME